MTEEFNRELNFTKNEHEKSFELLSGKGKVLLSAPHAVLQTRDGRLKAAERYTSMLCRMLHERVGCPCIYKTKNLGDDANHDLTSEYRDRLCEYVKENGIAYVLDLHQLAATRTMELCIGTGKAKDGLGDNLHGDERAVAVVTQAFESRGFAPVTLNDPFTAGRAHTVSATAAAHCGIPALQLEINTKLVQEDSAGFRFHDVLDALGEIVAALNKEPKGSDAL